MTQASEGSTRVLVVDDQLPNVRLLEALLAPRGYDVVTASSGEDALHVIETSAVDLVLLDIVMPGMDGYDVCRRIREHPDTAYLPVVMVTASGEEQKVRSLEAGADDFLTKPIDRSELLARVASLARIKRYQDTIKRQSDELASWNRELESRVQSQVAQLERMGNLRRFLSPQVAELVVDSGDASVLESHRREIVVVFCDLRGFTPFAEASEPEEVMGVLKEYHEALGDLIFRFEGTLERFAGDGLMVFFNDPVRCEDGPLRAIRMSVAMRTRVRGLAETWSRQGHDLSLGIGIAQGYATLGTIGFEGRLDYAAIGSVTNLAARLCAEAEPWQILVTARVFSGAGSLVIGEDAGERELRGFSRSIRTFGVRGLDSSEVVLVTGDVWTAPVGPAVLSAMDEEERYRCFDRLQARMGAVWDAMRLNHEDESVVVVPSITLDRAADPSGSMTQAMEERFLFLLVLLRQPRLRMVYVTSMPIAPEIVEYYLALLPGVIPSHARARLSLVAVHDASPRPLSRKLLDRPRLLRRIAALVPNPERSHLVPYNTTELERDVALSLGIPMYGADPRLAELGSKTGCRRLFADVAVPHPLGAENLHSLEDLATAVVDMRAGRPAIDSVIVKLNEGVSGQGNAMVDLTGLPVPGASDERRSVLDRLARMQLESSEITVETYLATFADGGGIVEERIVGTDLRSPSVQLRVLPGGDVELLSTHDQLLGGPSGQSYLGCVFPAAPEYARLISGHARAVGDRLASEGALGRFAVDFVVVRDEAGDWRAYAIEINLRKGGTTHPFLTLQFLTDGRYDAGTALFLTSGGHEKHLVATDHLESETLRGLVIADLFDIVARHGLHFDQCRQAGIVFHMISCLTEHGRVGLTAVGDTPEEAGRRYRAAERILLEEARSALEERPLPG